MTWATQSVEAGVSSVVLLYLVVFPGLKRGQGEGGDLVAWREPLSSTYGVYWRKAPMRTGIDTNRLLLADGVLSLVQYSLRS